MPTISPEAQTEQTPADVFLPADAFVEDTTILPIISDVETHRYYTESSRMLREWGFNPEELMQQARGEAPKDPNHILASWGMPPLPEQNIEAMVEDLHEAHFRDVFYAEVARLRGSGLSWHRARKEAYRLALLDLDGGYHEANEFGLQTEPDEERYMPGSFKDRIQQALRRMSKRASKVRGRLHHRTGEARAGFVDRLSPRTRKVAAALGVTAIISSAGSAFVAAETQVLGSAGEEILELPDYYFNSIDPEYNE